LFFPSAVLELTSINPILNGSASELPWAASTWRTTSKSDLHANTTVGMEDLDKSSASSTEDQEENQPTHGELP